MTRRSIVIALALLLASGIAVGPFGGNVASIFQAAAGSKIDALTAGKVADTTWFLVRLLREAWLATAGLAFLAAATTWLIGRARASCRPITASAAVLLALYALLHVAGGMLTKAILVWCLLWTDPPQNITQFRLKELIALNEPAGTKRRVIILGSSQANAQIDENLLNRMDTATRYSELHFPGSKPFDWLSITDRFDARPPDVYVVYVSERDIFTGFETGRLRYFLSWRRVHEAWARCFESGRAGIKPAFYAWLGVASPWFRYREALQQRVLGPAWMNMTARARDADEDDVVREYLALFRESPDVADELRDLRRFLEKATGQGADVILVRGRLRPDVAAQLPREMPDLLDNALHDMTSDVGDVRIVDLAGLHGAESFADITHFTKEAQERFTRELMLRLH